MAMNNKGFAMGILAFIIVGIIVVGFFAVFIYGFGFINTNLTSPTLDNSVVNVTKVTTPIIGNLNVGYNNLKLLSLVILIGFALGTLITAYFSTKHPIWIVVYILIAILFVIFSVYISNAYETLQTNALTSSIFTGFTASDMIIRHLPIWVSIISLLGIFLSIAGSVISRRLVE